MSGRRPVARERIDAALAFIADSHSDLGCVPRYVYEEAGARCGRSADHMSRLYRAPGEKSPSARLVLTRDEKVMLAARPTLTAGARELAISRGVSDVSEIGFYHRVRRAVERLPAGERSAIVERGDVDLVKYLPRAAFEIEAINQVNFIDHQLLDLFCRPEGRPSTMERPWATTLLDGMRFAKAAHVYCGPANATVVASVVTSGVIGLPLDKPTFGGAPGVLWHDNGSDFNSELIESLNRHLRVLGLSAEAYTPQSNGILERFHHEQKIEFCARQPGYTAGGHSPWHKRLEDHPQVPKDRSDLLTEAEVRDRHCRFVSDHNTRFHSALGMSPREYWLLNARDLNFPTFEDVVYGLLALPRSYPIESGGIRINNRTIRGRFVAPWMSKFAGRRVEVRILMGLGDTIFCSLPHGPYLGSATTRLADEERGALHARNRHERRSARALTDDAAQFVVDESNAERARERSARRDADESWDDGALWSLGRTLGEVLDAASRRTPEPVSP